jgi:hypothetical protein
VFNGNTFLISWPKDETRRERRLED